VTAAGTWELIDLLYLNTKVTKSIHNRGVPGFRGLHDEVSCPILFSDVPCTIFMPLIVPLGFAWGQGFLWAGGFRLAWASGGGGKGGGGRWVVGLLVFHWFGCSFVFPERCAKLAWVLIGKLCRNTDIPIVNGSSVGVAHPMMPWVWPVVNLVITICTPSVCWFFREEMAIRKRRLRVPDQMST
jgi:hypothetical protein